MRKHNNATKSPSEARKNVGRGRDKKQGAKLVRTVLPIIATAPREGYLVEKNEPRSLWPAKTTKVREGVQTPLNETEHKSISETKTTERRRTKGVAYLR